MADTYGVRPEDIGAELLALFPAGISAATRPSFNQVTTFISDADLAVSIAIENASGIAPQATDRVAPLARRVVIDRVKAQVIRIIFTNNDPASVNAAASPYELSAKDALLAITELTTQATGIGEPQNRMLTSPTMATRDLIICDDDLGSMPGTRF